MNDILQVTVVLGVLLVLAGCRGAEEPAPAPSQQPMAAHSIRELEAELHLDLPEKLWLLTSTDGGGRDPGFHLWLVYSTTDMTLSPKQDVQVGSLEQHLEPDWIAEWVSSLVPKGRLPAAKDAAIGTWTTGKHEYRAEVLRTVRGSYLVVQRFAAHP